MLTHVRTNHIGVCIDARVYIVAHTHITYTCVHIHTHAYVCACIYTLSPMCTLTCSHMHMNMHMCSHGHGAQYFRCPFIEAVDWVLISCWFSPLWQ